MENDTIWKVGLVVLVLLVVVGVYNNNNRGVEDVTGQVIGNISEVGVFKQVGIGTSTPSAKLDVRGDVKISGITKMNRLAFSTSAGTSAYVCVLPDGTLYRSLLPCGSSTTTTSTTTSGNSTAGNSTG